MSKSNFFEDKIDFPGDVTDKNAIADELKAELKQQIQTLEKALKESKQLKKEKQKLLKAYQAQLKDAKNPEETNNIQMNIEKIKSLLEEKSFAYLEKDSHNLIVQLKQQLKKLES